MSRFYLVLIICMTLGLYGCGSANSSGEKSGSVSVPKVKTELALVFSDQYGHGYVDQTGKVMYIGSFSIKGDREVQPFSKSSGTAAVFKKNDKGSKRWQFIDKTGKTVLEPEFQLLTTLHSFSSGRALFKDDTYVGYFDEKGKIVIPAQFGGGKDFGDNGLAPVSMSKHNYETTATSKWGYIDVEGNVKIPGQFATAEPFAQGLALISYDPPNVKFAFINEKGEKVIQSPQYRPIGSFASNGLAPVAMLNQPNYGYINKRGEIAIGAEYTRVRPFAENGLAGVEFYNRKAPDGKTTKWGFINSAGKWVIKSQYDAVGDFAENGLAPVKVGDRWGYIDQQGNMVIQPQFTWAGNFVVF